MDRPITTLFMLMSVDGKISTGSSDELDFDKDLPKIDGVSDGLYQYYEIEQTTDLWSLNSGRTQEKIGVNEKNKVDKSPVSFVVIDNNHLNANGVKYFSSLSKKFVLITSNKEHPAFKIERDNLNIIYQDVLDIKSALKILKKDFSCERITIQTGGTLNGLLLREKLIDYVDIVVAPILVGGKDTPTLIDGKSLKSVNELSKLSSLSLEKVEILKNSYIRFKYKVNNI